jgi:hypothetical protein
LIQVIKLTLQRSEEAFHDGIAAERSDMPTCGIASPDSKTASVGAAISTARNANPTDMSTLRWNESFRPPYFALLAEIE